MDYLNLTTKRLKQLENEKTLDYLLLYSYNYCPTTVFQYFLKSRELNRKCAQDIYTSSLFSYPEKIKNNLEIVDRLYQKYYTDCPHKLCDNLQSLIAEIDSLTKP